VKHDHPPVSNDPFDPAHFIERGRGVSVTDDLAFQGRGKFNGPGPCAVQKEKKNEATENAAAYHVTPDSSHPLFSMEFGA
jgi:hypothetical protein